MTSVAIAAREKSGSFMFVVCTCGSGKSSYHGRNCTSLGDHQAGNWRVNCQHSSYYINTVFS